MLYFSLLTHWVSEGLDKAKTDLQALYGRGVSPDALTALSWQQRQLNEDIERFSRQKAEFGKKLNEHAGFLFDPDYASRLSDQVAALLSKHHLREAGSDNPVDHKEVARTVLDVYQRLGETPGKKKRLSVWRINFTGFYPDVYRMLAELEDQRPGLVPVSLSMKPAPDDRLGMSWSLSFWVGVGE